MGFQCGISAPLYAATVWYGTLASGINTLYVQEADSAGNWSASASKKLVLSLMGPVGNPGFSTGPVAYPSLALNGLGIPYVAFQDGPGGKAIVMKLNAAGTTWETVGGSEVSPGAAYSTSLALSSSGVPYVAFEDGSNGHRVTVMRLNASGTGWETIGNVGFSRREVSSISLALSNAVPYVAFQDKAFGDKATVMRLNETGAEWETVGGIGGISPGEVQYISLAMSSKGVPYIAFRVEGSGFKAMVMRLNAAGTSWDTVGNAKFSPGEASNISLDLNTAGIPYVAFTDGANENKASVMRLNGAGSAWEAVGNAGFSIGAAYSTSLAMSNSGVPYVAFTDWSAGNKATVMRLNAAGTDWETVGSPGFTPGGAARPSLSLNNAEVPYIAFVDGSNATKITVMKTSFNP
jgi:hypothetical protein